MWSGKKRTLIAALLMISLFTLSSCTKHNSTSNKDDNANDEKEAVSDSNFTETNEDLLTVDYKQFYDELAPHGDWVQVSAKDLGIDLKKGESSGESSIFNDLIGVRDAYADDVDFGMFFVWRPSPELAVAVSTVEPAPVYVPYTRGQWVYTDAGWYFRAPTPYEEITVHYGRWVFSPAVGWVWVPGRVWAPAWVQWYEDDDYIGWAPLPPAAYIVDYEVPFVTIDYNNYVFVDRTVFVEPDIYRYTYLYSDYKEKINIKEMTKINGVMVKDNRVVNMGPGIDRIQDVTGKKIDPVKINKVDNMRNARFAGGELNSYSPHFTKVKGSDRKESITKPNNFVSYDHAESKYKNEKNAFQHSERKAGSNDNNYKASRDNTKDKKGNQQQYKGNNKQNNDQMSKGNRKNDYKQKDSYNGNQEKFRRKTNDNSKGSQQKEYKPKGNDKGNQQYKPRGNDKGGQQNNPKGNDRGGRQKQSYGNTHGNNNYGNGNDRGSNQTQGNGHGRGKH